MSKLKSGDLRHYVTVKKPVEGATDERGRRSVSWDEVGAVYAKVTDVSGREFFEAAAYHLEETVTFTIRYDSVITSGMRVYYGGDAYEIVEVNHLGYRGDFMTLKCKCVACEGGAGYNA